MLSATSLRASRLSLGVVKVSNDRGGGFVDADADIWRFVRVKSVIDARIELQTSMKMCCQYFGGWWLVLQRIGLKSRPVMAVWSLTELMCKALG